MTMNVVRPALASVASVVFRSANLKYEAMASTRTSPLRRRAGASRWLGPRRDARPAAPGGLPPPPLPSLTGLGGGRLRISLVVLAGVEGEQLHLDESARVELELTWRVGRSRLRSRHRRVLDDHPLVTLDEAVDEQLVRPGLEFEVLERVDVQRDRDRREIRRGFIVVDDDPLDPARAVGDEVAATLVLVGDRLLEERPQQV